MTAVGEAGARLRGRGVVAGRQRGELRAGDAFVLRTPLLPLTALVEWGNAVDLATSRRQLMQWLDLAEVREALFIASPGLASAIDAWRAAPESPAGQRVESALVKYVARMTGRATPFGLFSGVSMGRLGAATRIQLAPRGEYRRRTRLDNDYLFGLAARLASDPAARAAMRYAPNTSIYLLPGSLRYTAATLAGTARTYQLAAAEPTPYLDATLERARRGATRAELAAPLAGDEVTEADARLYIDQLIDAQLLVPALGVQVTGPEPLAAMIRQLEVAGRGAASVLLETTRTRLAELDAAGLGRPSDGYVHIATSLDPLGVPVELSRMFQVDMVKPAAATLARGVAAETSRAIEQLARIQRDPQPFAAWKRAFRARWDDRAVPLMEALDDEAGIGFESSSGPGADAAPLLAGLRFAPEAADAPGAWTAFERHMLRRLADALRESCAEIALGDGDLDAMSTGRAAELPDAFAAVVRIAATPHELARGEATLLLDACSGPSGAQLLGRFCHASSEIDALVRAHHAAEEALRPHALFAEIVHLNEGRIGNILCRPVLRGHELVYLGVSGAPAADQITLDDLDVAVRGERIVLTSRRLGKEVVPRLSTAHNFRLRSLTPYRFLCALAGQGTVAPRWSWGALGDAPFLPRVRIGTVVVSRATWNLDREDLAPIAEAVRAARRDPARRDQVTRAVAALRVRRELPRMLVVADGDRELPIDLDNPLLIAAFADELTRAPRCTLTELFPAPDGLVVHGPEGAFSNELVITFTRERAPDASPLPQPPRPRVQRDFPPGSEWLYAKIYCGDATGDRVLREAVADVARQAIADGDADRWFFLRYADPDPHLRVRFHGAPERLCGRVIPALSRALADGPASRLAFDTYARELERYGGDRGIELIEQLFWRDSEAVLEIVEMLEGDAGAAARWKLCVRGIDGIFATLGLDPPARLALVAAARDGLGREHGADAAMSRQLGERFARDRAELEHLLETSASGDPAHPLAPGLEILERRDAACAGLGRELQRLDRAGELAPGLAEIASSVVHMHANRLLRGSARAQELVIYDLLRRIYEGRRARAVRA